MERDPDPRISLVELKKRRLYGIVLTVVSLPIAIVAGVYVLRDHNYIAGAVFGFALGIIISSHFLTSADTVLRKILSFAPHDAKYLNPRKINREAFE